VGQGDAIHHGAITERPAGEAPGRAALAGNEWMQQNFTENVMSSNIMIGQMIGKQMEIN